MHADPEGAIQGFSTRAIHGGQSPDPSTGAVMPPVYLTSTYVQESIAVHKGYEYARGDNPTREAVEANVAARCSQRAVGKTYGVSTMRFDAIWKFFLRGFGNGLSQFRNHQTTCPFAD